MTNEGQLTLELNVRTAEQQKQIDSFLIREENDMKARIAFMKNQYRTLVDAGFYSEDIDFKFDIVSVTREVTVGPNYNDRF